MSWNRSIIDLSLIGKFSSKNNHKENEIQLRGKIHLYAYIMYKPQWSISNKLTVVKGIIALSSLWSYVQFPSLEWFIMMPLWFDIWMIQTNFYDGAIEAVNFHVQKYFFFFLFFSFPFLFLQLNILHIANFNSWKNPFQVSLKNLQFLFCFPFFLHLFDF